MTRRALFALFAALVAAPFLPRPRTLTFKGKPILWDDVPARWRAVYPPAWIEVCVTFGADGQPRWTVIRELP